MTVLGGAEPRGKLLWREVLLVRGAGRVAQVCQKRVQAGLIAQRQNDIQLQLLGCRQAPHQLSLPGDNCITHMARHQRLRTAVQTSGRENRRYGQHKHTNSVVHNSSCRDL